jgi:diguanylate cyclase (GGDEF)-like protein
VALIDVDHFMRVNDALGHQGGDETLRVLVQAAGRHLRDADVLARYGGDEFVIILPHTDASGAAAVAERILARVRALAIPTDHHSVRCSVSIGLGEFQPADNPEELFRRADNKMYMAKRRGKNQYTA